MQHDAEKRHGRLNSGKSNARPVWLNRKPLRKGNPGGEKRSYATGRRENKSGDGRTRMRRRNESRKRAIRLEK